jgi:hypothetical protein
MYDVTFFCPVTGPEQCAQGDDSKGRTGPQFLRFELLPLSSCGPWDLIATVYRHLGIDAKGVTVPDPTGRPMPILPEGEPIRELTV